MKIFTKGSLITSAIIAVTIFTGSAVAGDAASGNAKSAACAGCHGTKGISSTVNTPNLAGQKEVYLINATKAYRDGQRKDPLMGSFVSGLSDEDIADLAAFYAGMK
jgi:cytochrome c553